MKYKNYPSYRDSGIEWLNEIPTYWEINALRRNLIEHKQGFYSTEAYNDNGVKLLRITDIKDSGNVDFNCCPKVSMYPEDKHFLLRNGDFVFARTGGAGSFGFIDNLKEDILFASYLIRFRFNNTLISRFLKYYFMSLSFTNSINSNIHGGVNKNIHAEDIKDNFIAIPPINEQQQITNFLDNATQKMDTLIHKQENLIKLLKEKRQAVISYAVTKGLNPDVKFKDSGVEWLGDVPEHWGIALLSTIFDNNKEKNRGMKNNNLLSLSYGKIVNKNIDTSFGLLPESFESYQIVKPGYIILRLTDLQNDKKSLRTGLVTQEGIITSAYVGLKKKSKSIGNEKFIHYYLHTFDIYKGFYGMGSGVRQSLNFDELKKLRFLLPPKIEQEDIVEYINNKTSQIDKLIEKSNKSIELLKEKRTALISAAVTGKIDVRNNCA